MKLFILERLKTLKRGKLSYNLIYKSKLKTFYEN